MNITKSIKPITRVYKKLSNCGKILIFLVLFLILISIFKNTSPLPPSKLEGFQQNENYIFKEGASIYDNFYATVYDSLVYNDIKNDFEITTLLKETGINNKSVILDVGCGTGHHVAKLTEQNVDITGIDISSSMLKLAKHKFPSSKFVIGDALNRMMFIPNTYTHILCLYFTIYYFEDKRLFFNNCMDWLIPGGYLIVHLVNKDKFDPILPPGNPLYIVSPQKYAKKRITTTKITFNDFVYNSNFTIKDNIATFDEKFKFKNGNTRRQEHTLYMDDDKLITAMAQESGFILHSVVDMVKCAYENQYLYIFLKPA